MSSQRSLELSGARLSLAFWERLSSFLAFLADAVPISTESSGSGSRVNEIGQHIDNMVQDRQSPLRWRTCTVQYYCRDGEVRGETRPFLETGPNLAQL